jgi:translocation and assembly module TamA
MWRSGLRWLPVSLAAGAAAGCAGQETKRGAVVGDVEIRGTQALSESEIKKRILTSETPWWPFAKKRYFDPVEWQSDLARIERLYQTRGYYRAQVVKSDVKVQPAGRKPNPEVELLVEVEEDEPVRVAELRLEGIDLLTPPERELVLDDLPVQQADIFREGAWNQAKAQVSRRLRDLGYARAQVVGQAQVDVGTQQAHLHIRTAPGRRYQFGDIQVDTGGGRGASGASWGKRPVDPTWVREQVHLALEDEPTYSEEALDEAQRRVFAMGVFSTVRVDTGDDTADGRLPVEVHVRPAPVHSLRLGTGLGFDQVRQEARLMAEWTDRNWLGGLRRMQLRGMAGWAFLPSTIAVFRSQVERGPRNGFIYRAAADFDQPRVLGRPSLRLNTLLESEKTLEETYDAWGGRFMTGVRWEPHSTVSLFPTYNLQGYQLSGPRTITPQSAPLTLGCRTDPCFVLLSYLEQVIAWDTRDDPLQPRRGHYLALSLQEGGGPLGGGFDYLRILPEARGYVSVGEDDRITFAARARMGSLITASGNPDDSAVVTRFYSGGSMWMRGFSVRRLSPMILIQTPGSKDPQSKLALPIGGNGLVEGNVEVRSRFSDALAAAAFVDYGTVTRSRTPLAELHRMMWAVGFGIRYLTPVGPLRADLGFRLPFGRPPTLLDEQGNEISYLKGMNGTYLMGPESGANVNNSCFGIGGNADNLWVRDGLCSFHISIGEAF